MKYLKKFEDTYKGPEFQVGDYVKYLFKIIRDDDPIIITDDDFFIITNIEIDGDKYFYKITKIDKNFNLTPVKNVGINEHNLEIYYPTEEEKNEIAIKLNIDKYNL